MSSKAVSKLFWFFAFLCFLLFIQTEGEADSIPASSNAIQPINKVEEINIERHFPLFYASYQEVKTEKDDDKKLVLISETLKLAKQEGFTEKKILQELHLIAGNIHQSRWHVVFALERFKKAQTYVFDKSVERQIKELRKYLGKVEVERGLNDDYIATKYSGPAKTFTGKIVVAYVFVDEGIKTRWSNKTKLRTQQIMQLVQQWQTSKAKDYQVENIEFINKIFIARKNPALKHQPKISFGSSSADIKQFVVSIAESLGEKSIGDFIEKQIKLSNADQGVVFLHTNLDQRSFAHRCGYTHKKRAFVNGKFETTMISQCKDEYVMLMEEVKRNRWDKMHYAQAHEMMHVFGAADLYNIKLASDYAVTDIMNYQSKRLSNSNVDPITAYAIGWKDEAPEAPFKILER